MPTFVLDAGALIAVDRGNRAVLSMLQGAFESGHAVRVPAGVIGQVWRSPDRQVLVARTLKRCNEVPLDGTMARLAGELCGWAGMSDMIDASVAIVVSNTRQVDDEIVLLTSDTTDLRALLSAVGAGARIVEL